MNIRTYFLDPTTDIVHLSVSFDEGDLPYLKAESTRGLMDGVLARCGRLYGVWVPPDTPLTCLDCVAAEPRDVPRRVR